MISLKAKGNFNKTEEYLEKLRKRNFLRSLDQYGQEGVMALAAATPVDSGTTAASWTYEIVDSGNSIAIQWSNTNANKGVPIAIILQYGHGTGTGGYVQGRDYINPAIRPVLDRIQEEVWKEMITT